MASRLLRFLHVSVMVVAVAAVTALPARADQATDKARSLYETGLELFYAREHAQALIEFQRAHEVKPRPATMFMMGQCEYLLGSLRQARDHYEAYLRESPTGEFVEVAKDRVESINRRPATLVINTVPDQVDVRITPTPPVATTTPTPAAGGAPPPPGATTPPAVPATVAGQAPNNFAVPRGRWRIAVSKANYQSQQVTVEVDVADTKPLFFKLEPIPAHLEIETMPAGATLYVKGNRTSNPYRQDVSPGRFEIIGEATDHEERHELFDLGPGEKRLLIGTNAFRLRYIQRSGRPELVAASAIIGGLVGAGAVAWALGSSADPNASSVSLLVGGALAGSVTGGLVANAFVPAYIPDNRALFILGSMWIGAAEGALGGIIVRQTQVTPARDQNYPDLGKYKKQPDVSSAAFIGSLPGLAAGITMGSLLSRHAPTYGRVSLIQSAAAGGALVGGLTAAALQWNPFGWQRAVPDRDGMGNEIKINNVIQYHLDSGTDPSIPALIGLNVGLGAGLLGAYLPDLPDQFGPSWKRIVLIDLAAVAGALAGGIAGCVSGSNCVGAITAESSGARARAAGFALLGGGVGLLGGILLTRDVDRVVRPAPATPPPSLTLLPMPDGKGGITPALGAFGFF